MNVLVLCGGLGTRVSAVLPGIPKAIAQVGGVPFLNHMLSRFIQSGRVTNFVFLTGHLGDYIHQLYGDSYLNVPIVYSQESEPLGTGGAIINALRQFHFLQKFIVFNADTYFAFTNESLDNLLEISGESIGLLATYCDDISRYGSLILKGNRVTSFREKFASGPGTGGYINAGIYGVSREIIESLALEQTKCSLEVDILQKLSKIGAIEAVTLNAEFIDIGTPRSLYLAQQYFKPTP